jgi:hypothetical protein
MKLLSAGDHQVPEYRVSVAVGSGSSAVGKPI